MNRERVSERAAGIGTGDSLVAGPGSVHWEVRFTPSYLSLRVQDADRSVSIRLQPLQAKNLASALRAGVRAIHNPRR